MQGHSFSFHGQDFGNFEYKTADHYQKVILIYKKKPVQMVRIPMPVIMRLA